MTDNLGRLAAIIKARTPGRWRKTFDVLRDAGCISTQSQDLFRSYKGPTDQVAKDCDFIAALGSCADELLAVVLAAKITTQVLRIKAQWQETHLEDALAALDARLAAVLPGGEP